MSAEHTASNNSVDRAIKRREDPVRMDREEFCICFPIIFIASRVLIA